MFRLASAQIWPLLTPLHEPIRMSFGFMQARPSLLLQLVDEDGVEGWGEAWVNFPHWALAERTLVLHNLLKSHLHDLTDPSTITDIRHRFSIEVIQSGSFGAFYHALSAIELALWDLKAKKERLPLRNLLLEPDGNPAMSVPVYASGIGPNEAVSKVEQAVQDGFVAAKIKVGFVPEEDHRRFRQVQRVDGITVAMVDANQAWTVEEASKELAFYEEAQAGWVEEPIFAWDFSGYTRLGEQFSRMAAGENWYLEHSALSQSIRLKALQPDLCKIGGIQAAKSFLSDNLAADWVAFHVLSGPIAQTAALQVASAWYPKVKWVEVDRNENAIRSAFRPAWTLSEGRARLTDQAGLGIEVDTARLGNFVAPELRMYHDVIHSD